MKQERTKRTSDKKIKWKVTSEHRHNTKEKNKRKKVGEQSSHLLLFYVCALSDTSPARIQP